MRNPNTSQDIDLKIHLREILRRQESQHIKAGNKNITNLKRPSFHSDPDAGCKSPVGGSETTEWNVPGKKKPEDASPVVPDCEDYD